MAQAKSTTDHDTIRNWVEERGGFPATVGQTVEGGDAGILRIDFPEAPESEDDNLLRLEWGEFFEKFEEAELAFLYQEQTDDGQTSRFCKFVSRD